MAFYFCIVEANCRAFGSELVAVGRLPLLPHDKGIRYATVYILCVGKWPSPSYDHSTSSHSRQSLCWFLCVLGTTHFRLSSDSLARTPLLVFIMQLKSSFAALLAGVLATIQLVEAAPATPGMVTLPLKRVEQRSADVHPSIYLQQHINRGIRRLARMTGREVSEHQLRANLEKRVAAIGDEELTKRFNRMGLSSSQKATRGVKELRKNRG
jgi:hypothetical protein